MSFGIIPAAILITLTAMAVGGRKSRGSKSNVSNSGKRPLRECDGVFEDGGTVAGLNYIELVTGGAHPDDYLPMVIALHGLGQDKEYLANKLDDFEVPARIIIPDAFYDRTGDLPGRKWWSGYHPDGLQAHMAEKIPEASEKLAPFVAELPRCLPTLGSPVIAGHSQGGYIALDFAASFPELISASTPSAAWRPVALWDIEPRARVIAMHGEKENHFERSLEYYEEMIARGAPVELHTTSGAHSLGSTNLSAWQAAIAQALGVPPDA